MVFESWYKDEDYMCDFYFVLISWIYFTFVDDVVNIVNRIDLGINPTNTYVKRNKNPSSDKCVKTISFVEMKTQDNNDMYIDIHDPMCKGALKPTHKWEGNSNCA